MTGLERGRVAAMLLGVVAGCSASRGPLVVGSDDPAVNLPAMVAAADRGQREKMAKLVEQLDSRDPAVRMFAIRSLAELTGGETLGYRYFDPRRVRLGPMNRWRKLMGLPEVVPTTIPTAVPRTMPSTRSAEVATEGGGA